MKNKITTTILAVAFMFIIYKQGWGQSVGINATGAVPDASAMLDVSSTSKGFAMPRMTTLQRYGITAPAAGLQVYDIDLKGVYYYDGTIWDCLNNPAGTVQYFANITAPHGYLECNGQAVPRAQYPELFAAINTVYGPGDGSTTFNLPDLRGEFLRGYDNGRGADPGRGIGTYQVGTAANNHIADVTMSEQNIITNLDPGGTTTFDGKGYASNFVQTYSNPGSRGMVRPRNVAMLPCIKY